MNDMKKNIQEIFDAIILPPGLKEETLASIAKEARLRQDEGFVETAPIEVSRHRHSSASFLKRISFAIAACLILVVIGFGGYGAYATETAVVGIEVNPSIELGVNRFGTTIAARALNEEGQRVLDEVSVVGKPYDEALSLITASNTLTKFINEEYYVDINVVCGDDNQAGTLIAQSDSTLQTLPVNSGCKRVSGEVYDEAHEAGMGMGRYQAAQELMELNPDLTLDECKSMSMRDLCGHIAAIDPENEYATHYGHGQGSNGQNQGQGHQEHSGNNSASGQDKHGNGSGSGQRGTNKQSSEESQQGQQGQNSGTFGAQKGSG